jgi:hypothetical protein
MALENPGAAAALKGMSKFSGRSSAIHAGDFLNINFVQPGSMGKIGAPGTIERPLSAGGAFRIIPPFEVARGGPIR